MLQRAIESGTQYDLFPEDAFLISRTSAMPVAYIDMAVSRPVLLPILVFNVGKGGQ